MIYICQGEDGSGSRDNMDIKVVPLGAGQDVGRSCIIISIGGKNVMFDCGMHMGYNDERRFPDFKFLSRTGNYTSVIDAVVVSHFHLDHCGALPYFTELCGYDGPIYMTHPTKAICPILLEDYRKIMVDRKGETNFFTSEDIKNCMRKVVSVRLHETVEIGPDFDIKAYYAGHVLGAAMFRIRVGSQSVVYTGDYNMTPDRHLGSAWIDKCRPDLLITETTYATTIRDSKRCRERDFLQQVHRCVENGGKVLVPVFALGRAQELCILIDTYWERMNIRVPVYFSAGLVEKATHYYKLFINWTNQKIKNTFVERNMFDFKHIKPLTDRGVIDQPGPMVLFATPGMLHAGTSLEVFKAWAPSEKNLVIIPGYCVVGTVGNKLLSGQSKQIEIDRRTVIDVKCQVKHLSFSAHADAKGIMQLISQCEPRNVMLVHGEKGKMQFLKAKIARELAVPCFDPPNGTTVTMRGALSVPLTVTKEVMKSLNETTKALEAKGSNGEIDDGDDMTLEDGRTPMGGLVSFKRGAANAMDLQATLHGPNSTAGHIGMARHHVAFHVPVSLPASSTAEQVLARVRHSCVESDSGVDSAGVAWAKGGVISLRSIRVQGESSEGPCRKVTVAWDFEDDALARRIVTALRTQQ